MSRASFKYPLLAFSGGILLLSPLLFVFFSSSFAEPSVLIPEPGWLALFSPLIASDIDREALQHWIGVRTTGIFLVLIPSVFFLRWNLGLLKGAKNIPLRSIVVFVVFAPIALFSTIKLFSVVQWDVISVWLDSTLAQFFSWNYEHVWSGSHIFRRAMTLTVINSFCMVALSVLVIVGLRKPSYRGNFMFHWLLAFWLGWYAFPQTGEVYNTVEIFDNEPGGDTFDDMFGDKCGVDIDLDPK